MARGRFSLVSKFRTRVFLSFFLCSSQCVRGGSAAQQKRNKCNANASAQTNPGRLDSPKFHPLCTPNHPRTRTLTPSSAAQDSSRLRLRRVSSILAITQLQLADEWGNRRTAFAERALVVDNFITIRSGPKGQKANEALDHETRQSPQQLVTAFSSSATGETTRRISENPTSRSSILHSH